jgi:hypothetical protein
LLGFLFIASAKDHLMFKLPALMTALAIATAPASATELFNGLDLTGWELVTTPAAKASDVFVVRPGGVIAVSGKPPGFLQTVASYRNYRLHVEWRWSGQPGNAGVLLHISPGPMDRVWPISLQVQTKHGSAGDLLPMAHARFTEPLTSAPDGPVPLKGKTAADSERPVGEWNSADIVSRDGTLEVCINGVLQNRASGLEPKEGRIGFQLEGTPYELRNVRLAPLD